MTVRVYVGGVVFDEVHFNKEDEAQAIEFASEQQDNGLKVRIVDGN